MNVLVIDNQTGEKGLTNLKRVVERYGCNDTVVFHADLPHINLVDLTKGIDVIILSGGEGSVNPLLDEVRFERDLLDIAQIKRIPVLGICYGFQLVSQFFGGLHGEIHKLDSKILDPTTVDIVKKDPIFSGVDVLIVNQNHEEYIPFVEGQNYVGDLEILGMSECLGKKMVEVVRSKDGLLYGVQFHPERITEGREDINGHQVIFNFLEMVRERMRG